MHLASFLLPLGLSLVSAADPGPSTPPHLRRMLPVRRSERAISPPPLRIGGVDLEIHQVATRRESSHLGRRANGSIIALDDSESTYVVPVALGTPPFAYPLQLDTGSADLLIASTQCGKSCPGATSQNPYYDLGLHSPSFVSINDNQTEWQSSYGDGTVASGFVALERVGIAGFHVDSQVFGVINATNLTLVEQKVSGILGLGFPRLSTLSDVLEDAADVAAAAASAMSIAATLVPGTAKMTGSVASMSDAPSTHELGPPQAPTSSAVSMQKRAISSAATPALSAAAAAASTLATPFADHPPLLQSLFSQPDFAFPVFGLALAPPPNVSVTAADAAPSTGPRYSVHAGSLTLGGVSGLYVSTNASSGYSLNDIEWVHVVPFGSVNKTAPVTAAVSAPSSTSASSASPSASAAMSPADATADQLSAESYLYWAVELSDVAVNATSVGVNSTYASLGLGSIALLDVGTNGIYGPQQDVERIFDLIKDARQVATGQWAVPCDTNATLGFSFGGRYVHLQPSDWMSAAVSGSSMCLAWPMAIPDSGDGIDWQLGTPFLRNVYTVFSYGINGVQAPLVGFLPLEGTLATDTTATGIPTPTTIVPATLTRTVNTILPNQLLAGPDYPTPAYVFSTPIPSRGVLQSSGLANASAYLTPVGNAPLPIFSVPTANASASSNTDVPGWPGGAGDRSASSAAAAVPGLVGWVALCLLVWVI